MRRSAVSVQRLPERNAPPHILVVDDATVVRLYYRQILEGQGFRVAEAINGVEGIERALQTQFDLCVVDVNMPIMDGYLFVRTLRREPPIHAMPVLMTSTQASPADRLLARRAGANFYLVKPVAQARLARVAAIMLGLRDPELPAPDIADPDAADTRGIAA
jgi:two-component system chemotaxis response regulator CheY